MKSRFIDTQVTRLDVFSRSGSIYKATAIIVFSVSSFIADTGHAAVELIDDFSAPVVDCSHWGFGTNAQFDIHATGGRLYFSMDPYTTDQAYCRAMARLDNSIARDTDSMSTTVMIDSINYDTAMDSTSFAMEGYFYNTRSDIQRSPVGTNPDSEGDSPHGDVWASIRFGDRGNGLEAWWFILETQDAGYVSETIFADGTLIGPGTLATSTDYPISISYDGNKQFSFSFNGQTTTIDGPDRSGNLSTFTAAKRIGVRSDIDSSMTPAIGTRTISANIGAMNTNGSAFDDFLPNLDNTLWRRGEREVYINTSNETMQVEINSNYAPTVADAKNNEQLQVLPPDFSESRIVQSTHKLVSVDLGTRGRTRITGVWYNAEKANGQYNGHQGNVFAQLVLERRNDGTYRAFAYAETVDDRLWESGTQIFFQNLNMPITAITADTFYDLTLERTDTSLVFTVTESANIVNTITHTHTITTPIYPVSPGTGYHSVQTRINPENLGSMIAELDNIYSEKTLVGVEDSADNAMQVAGTYGSSSTTNRNATAEAGEPYHGAPDEVGTPSHTVWIDWTAPSSGRYTFDTNGSSFDTLLSVYSDALPPPALKSGVSLAPISFPDLIKEAGNNDASPGAVYSKLTFEAERGVTYHVAIDGNNGTTGNIVLNYRTLEIEESCFPIIALENSKTAIICL